MITTPDQRKQAVQLATHLLDTPGIAGDVKLLCQVVVDCRDTFVLYAPIVDAAKRLVAPRGACVTEWEQPWTDLITSVQALRKVMT